MSFDIDKYRDPNETEKVWQLKKTFIEKYRDKFDEKRLLCLAQCYVNIETIGCRYSSEIMNQIKQLTSGFESSFNKERTDQLDNMKKIQNQIQQKKNINQNRQDNYSNGKYSNQAEGNKSEYNDNAKHKFINKVTLQLKIESENQQIKQQEKHQVFFEKHQSQQSKQIQILSRNQNNQNDLTAFFKPASNVTTSISFSSKVKSNPEQQSANKNIALLSLIRNPANNSAPQSTSSELAPAPTAVPKPFGLSPSLDNKNSFTTNLRRNVLLDVLGSDSSHLNNKKIEKQDPISLLMSGGLISKSVESNNISTSNTSLTSDDLFNKLNKLNRLREFLKIEKTLGKQNFPSDNFEIFDYLNNACAKVTIDLKYLQFFSSDDNLYRGELFIESFRLICDVTKKRKKCKYYVYKNALDLLCSQSEIAVRLVGQIKREKSFQYDKTFRAQSNEKNQNDLDFKYELYRIDSNNGLIRSPSDKDIIKAEIKNQKLQSQSPKNSIIDQLFVKKADEKPNNLSDLSQLLKSMLLPNKKTEDDSSTININNNNYNNVGENNNDSLLNKINSLNLNYSNNTNDDSKESQNDNDDQDEDDDEKSENIDRKARIKKNLINFHLLIPANIDEKIDTTNLENFIHEKNSIQLLNDSCVKSNCNLEFEIKQKSIVNGNKSTKTIVSASNIESDESEDNNLSNGISKKKYKCKCLINGLKISSSHSKSKSDAKRSVALKAIKTLSKIFPVIKVNKDLYDNLDDSKSQNEQQNINISKTKYVKITKEELFNGVIPSTLLVPPSVNNQIASNLGYGLLKKMGWKGEGFGLGKGQHGPTEPLNINYNSGRIGLGYEFQFDDISDEDNLKTQNWNYIDVKHVTSNLVNILKAFIRSDVNCDLIFDRRLTSEQRKIIHRQANRLALLTKSQGNGSNRFLVVSKKNDLRSVVKSISENNNASSKYELISKGDYS